MKRRRHILIASTCFIATATVNQSIACEKKDAPERLEFNEIDKLELVNLKATPTEYADKKCLRLVASGDGECLAGAKGIDFKNGTIELELVGRPRRGAPASAKGFIGVAFRLKNKKPRSYECIYVRPLNSRSKDAKLRSHTTQYCSIPDYPWFRLREESPGVYESHVDIDRAKWTKIKVVVEDRSAKLFVNESKKPSLVVDDLKLGNATGAVAIWMHATTEAFVRSFHVTPAKTN